MRTGIMGFNAGEPLWIGKIHELTELEEQPS